MNELLAKLLSADILTEDVKVQLQEAITAELNEAKAVARAETETVVRAELKEQWAVERDALIEAIDSKVSEFCVKEFEDLREDISRFRDLEAEYAEKIVEEKAKMKVQLQSDINTLVEKIDAFLELRLAAEMEELKEDMNRVKESEFGRNVFEAFVNEYRKNFVDGSKVEVELKETREQLQKANRQLKESKAQIDEQVRNAKLKELLAPLSGKKREVMETILAKLPTNQLDEGFKQFIGRVVRESDDSKEKENKVLAEGSSDDVSKNDKKTIVKSGDDEVKTVVNESVEDPAIAEMKAKLRRLSGIDE